MVGPQPVGNFVIILPLEAKFGMRYAEDMARKEVYPLSNVLTDSLSWSRIISIISTE
jgi:hypothetical protein